MLINFSSNVRVTYDGEVDPVDDGLLVLEVGAAPVQPAVLGPKHSLSKSKLYFFSIYSQHKL